MRKNIKAKLPITLFDILKTEKQSNTTDRIYHKIQIDLTYNSNHIEGSRLTHDETRYIYETNTIRMDKKVLNVDDIIETTNHFRCNDIIIDYAQNNLTETLIKNLHFTLKNGTSDSRKDWFIVGGYKKFPNEVEGESTTPPELVAVEMKQLLQNYNSTKNKTLNDIINFHYNFEKIHPFQDGNGRVGRSILLMECLKYNIVPFIIDNNLKMLYY